MSSHDITRRFVVVYHSTPVDSFDDEASAHKRMTEMRDTQLRSWSEHWPLYKLDNSALWAVKDMAKSMLGTRR